MESWRASPGTGSSRGDASALRRLRPWRPFCVRGPCCRRGGTCGALLGDAFAEGSFLWCLLSVQGGQGTVVSLARPFAPPLMVPSKSVKQDGWEIRCPEPPSPHPAPLSRSPCVCAIPSPLRARGAVAARPRRLSGGPGGGAVRGPPACAVRVRPGALGGSPRCVVVWRLVHSLPFLAQSAWRGVRSQEARSTCLGWIRARRLRRVQGRGAIACCRAGTERRRGGARPRTPEIQESSCVCV